MNAYLFFFDFPACPFFCPPFPDVLREITKIQVGLRVSDLLGLFVYYSAYALGGVRLFFF